MRTKPQIGDTFPGTKREPEVWDPRKYNRKFLASRQILQPDTGCFAMVYMDVMAASASEANGLADVAKAAQDDAAEESYRRKHKEGPSRYNPSMP